MSAPAGTGSRPAPPGRPAPPTHRPRREPARLPRALRSIGASSLLVTRRRARRDVWLLLSSCALIALSTLLASAGPRVVLDTIDGGAQDSVAAGDGSAALNLTTLVGDAATLSTGSTRVNDTADFVELGATVADNLPPALHGVHDHTVVTAVSRGLEVVAREGRRLSWEEPEGRIEVQVSLLTDAAGRALEVVEGRLPQARPANRQSAPVEVVLSVEAARAARLEVGTELTIAAGAGPAQPALDDDAVPGVRAVVAGLVAPQDPTSDLWWATPEVWDHTFQEETSDRSAFTRVAVLTTVDGVAAVSGGTTTPFTGTFRLVPGADGFTSQVAAEASQEIAALRTSTSALAAGASIPLRLETGLDALLDAFPAQARAALAQMSVMIAGVIGVAGVVVVLLSRLLIIRRSGVLALERARGASVAAVSLRLGGEAVLVALVGAALGLGLAWLLVPGPVRDPLPVAAVLLVAVLAPPLQGAWLARRAWTGQREPANRQDRAQLHKRRLARRTVAEVAVALLAGAAAFSLRGRGLLQTQTDRIDPFLAVAPLLLALTVTLVVLRVYPWPVRVVGALGRRTRGVLGLLGAVRAQRAVAALPLLALTLGMSLAVAGGLLVGTVREGQVEASWERVGADVRVDGDLDPGAAERLVDAPGVTGVGAAKVSRDVQLDLGIGTHEVTVMAVDRGFAPMVRRLPGDTPLLAADLEVLAAPVAPGDPLPVVVDESLVPMLVEDTFAVYLGPAYLKLEVVGTTEHGPAGYLDGPVVYLDLDNLSPRMPEPQRPSSVWVTGPQADDAVDVLGLPADSVVSRAGWLEDRRSLALLAGVQTMMVLAVAAVALLAVVALVATVLGGARDRGRALSMLRTLGMSPRLGWWLALAEIAPVLVAALVGGAASGVAIVVLLAPALGLDVLAGGTRIPDPAISPDVIVALCVGALVLLVLSVMAEVLAHRRDRLSEVLRVGETV